MTVENGVYHHEPQWEYNVSHSEEAARGQDGSGDLYSPGWISADLKVGEQVVMTGVYEADSDRGKSAAPFRWCAEQLPSVVTAPVPDVLARSLDLFIVKRDDLKTVIAGYPWFLDWGRDTFIFMRGMIAAGKITDSVRILKARIRGERHSSQHHLRQHRREPRYDRRAALVHPLCAGDMRSRLREPDDGA